MPLNNNEIYLFDIVNKIESSKKEFLKNVSNGEISQKICYEYYKYLETITKTLSKFIAENFNILSNKIVNNIPKHELFLNKLNDYNSFNSQNYFLYKNFDKKGKWHELDIRKASEMLKKSFGHIIKRYIVFPDIIHFFWILSFQNGDEFGKIHINIQKIYSGRNSEAHTQTNIGHHNNIFFEDFINLSCELDSIIYMFIWRFFY